MGTPTEESWPGYQSLPLTKTFALRKMPQNLRHFFYATYAHPNPERPMNMINKLELYVPTVYHLPTPEPCRSLPSKPLLCVCPLIMCNDCSYQATYSAACYSLLEGLLSLNPEKRLSAREALDHEVRHHYLAPLTFAPY
jgi:serine/threonine protein kinase